MTDNAASGLGQGERSHGPRNARNAALEAGSGRDTDSTLDHAGKIGYATPLTLVYWNHFWLLASRTVR